MHDLLCQVESITSCRDRESLAAHLLRAVRALIGGGQIVLIDSENRRDGQRLSPYAEITADRIHVFSFDGARPGFRLATPAPLLLRATEAGEAVLNEHDNGFHCVFPLRTANPNSGSGCLAVSAARQATAEEIETLSWFVRIYGNYLDLLDYSEFDTLTRLLNRKTFDDAFERLIARTQPLRTATEKERRQTEGEAWWLAVIDIDHFKRVNDNFGHLFGDEVLLRVANLMRESFRGYDLLFRFGGEEFVVMLQSFSVGGAEIALERFRRAVEKHEFPQIGQVTCSIGFTAVDALRAQTDMLGQADAALYWCKKNGRNRIAAYEGLVASGMIPPIGATGLSPDIDIDALFS